MRPNGKMLTFTRKSTKMYEQLVKLYAAQAVAQRRDWNKQQSYQVSIQVGADRAVVYVVPLLVRKRQVRSDLDNIAKSILDAMNGLVYDDDRKVVSLTIEEIEDAAKVETAKSRRTRVRRPQGAPRDPSSTNEEP